MSGVTVGGAYQESEDFIPNPADMRKQFNTSGLGASGRIEEVTAVFDVDKVRIGEQIVSALDPDDDTVPSDRVVLPSLETDNEAASKAILATAEKRVEKGVVIGGPSEAEKAAAEPVSDQARAEGDPLKAPAPEDTKEEAVKSDKDTSTPASTPATKAPAKK